MVDHLCDGRLSGFRGQWLVQDAAHSVVVAADNSTDVKLFLKSGLNLIVQVHFQHDNLDTVTGSDLLGYR